MTFRYDINGLRAIAVIAVVLFHFNPLWVPGGFAGVDVFFVISGFLMTGIIFKGLENNSFSLFKFYVARANRIIPAMAVLCLAMLVFGWFYLSPVDYPRLGKDVASSLGFLSNFFYAREFGYFEQGIHEKWLLHTWSLSVEWQFYIIFPIALLILKTFFSLLQLKRLLVLGTILLFGFSVFATAEWPRSAYYLLPTRAWEMMFGGIAYFYPLLLKDSQKKYVEWMGIALIISSYALISSSTPWPGHLALLPVLGAYLIIIANNQNSIITNNPPFQWLGKWSYSIYLWHWPIVVFGHYVEVDHWWVYGIPLSILFGYLSYTFIERYQWQPLQEWKSVGLVKPLWMAMLIAGTASFVYLTEGVKGHYPPAVVTASDEQLNKNPHRCMIGQADKTESLKQCYIGNKDNIKALVIGDSHADSVTTALTSELDLKAEGAVTFIRANCPFVINAKDNRNSDICYEENFSRLEQAKNYAGTPIIIISRWTAYIYGQSDPKRIRNGDNRASMYFGEEKYMAEAQLLQEFSKNLTTTLCSLPKTSPKFIMQPVPEMGTNVPATMTKALLFGEENIDLSIEDDLYFARNSNIRRIISDAATTCKAVVLDPSEILCQKGRCIADINGRPIYFDGDHLNEFGNKLLTPLFNKYF
mgnify:CR=1 FL=1